MASLSRCKTPFRSRDHGLLLASVLRTTSRFLSQSGPTSEGSDSDRRGWFSRLIGVPQNVEPMSASHSSLLADKEYIYELTTHSVKDGNFDTYFKNYEEYVKSLRQKVPASELVGSWRVIVGDQNQAVHLFRYTDGFTGIDLSSELHLSDKDLQKAVAEQAKMCGRRRNCFMHAFSFWGDPEPRPPSNVYEMRTYTLKPGTMIEWGNNWAKGINYRKDFNQNVAGLFSQIGPLYRVVHIWAYKDLQARKKIREETWRKPGWDTNVAYTVPLIRKMKSEVMVPASYSPLQ